MRCLGATAFLPVHEIPEALQIIRDDMQQIHGPGVELVDWFRRYYVGDQQHAALFPPRMWVFQDPNQDR